VLEVAVLLALWVAVAALQVRMQRLVQAVVVAVLDQGQQTERLAVLV
jgi:hypothetical protein